MNTEDNEKVINAEGERGKNNTLIVYRDFTV